METDPEERYPFMWYYLFTIEFFYLSKACLYVRYMNAYLFNVFFMFVLSGSSLYFLLRSINEKTNVR